MSMTPQLTWDIGTAYDLFTSLNVVHDPARYGLRGSWAAGVRSRLPAEQREFLHEAVEHDYFWATPWLASQSGPKDGDSVLKKLAAIPAGRRLQELSSHHMSQPFQDLLFRVAEQGTWDAEDKNLLRDREGNWNRENNRGYELQGKTIGIVGYGNMGKSFAQKLQGFDVTALCYDILKNVGDSNAKQVSLSQLQQQADVLSLHIPWTEETNKMVNESFINQFTKPFWFINTSRGKNVVTTDLVTALQSGKIIGAALDVLEYEKLSFENLFLDQDAPQALTYLLQAENVLLTPHIAGWTHESHQKLAQTIVDKIKRLYQ